MLATDATTMKQYGAQAQAGVTTKANALFDSFVRTFPPVNPPKAPAPNPLANSAYQTPDPSIPLFRDGDAYNDTQQGSIGNCGLVAGIAEIGYKLPDLIPQIILDNRDGTYDVKYFKGANVGVPGTPAVITIDNKLPLGYMNWQRELWAALLEKTAAIVNPFQDVQSPSYAGTIGMFPMTAMGMFAGGTQTLIFGMDLTKFEAAYNANTLLCLESQYSLPNGAPLVANHAYAVLSYVAATRIIKLWNPWAFEQFITWGDAAAYCKAIDATQVPAGTAVSSKSLYQRRRRM